MFLVIAGHIFMQDEFSGIKSCIVTWKWIYIFHMPLFIFISGYFSRKKEKKDLWPSIWKLAEPLIIYHTIGIILELIIKNRFSFSGIFTPWWILWYLLSLIYWRLMIQIIPDRILNNAKLILIIAFCISISAGFLPFNRFLSLQRTLSFMPFFFLGYYMKGKNIFLPDKYRPFSFLLLISMIAVPLFFPQILGSLTHSDPYTDGIYDALKRLFIFSLAIVMSLAFINICPNIKWISKQGRLTMQYYIYHALTIQVIMNLAKIINIPMTYFSAAIYTMIITIGIGIASYSPYFRKFTNPSTFLNKKRK